MIALGWPLLLLGPALWFVLRHGERRRAQTLAQLVGMRAPAWGGTEDGARRAWRRGLRALGVVLAVVAWSIPETRGAPVASKHSGIDLVVALDVSRSMQARDLVPDRLGRAKRELIALAAEARGNRIALVLFAGDARVHVPLTQDVLSFAHLLAGAGPTDVERGGTDLGQALEAAGAALAGDEDRHGAILLMTDGEDLEGRGLAAAEALAQDGIPVHAIGFGSGRGSKITVAADRGTAFLRDREGREVVSMLDAPGLRRIAEATGGTYRDARAGDEIARELFTDIAAAAQAQADAQEQTRPAWPYQVPLLGAFLCWTIALAMGTRRRRS